MEINSESLARNIEDEIEDEPLFSIKDILGLFILNWKWFVISIAVSLAAATLYLKYQTPIYMSSAKIFIKGESGGRRGSSLNVNNLGTISNSEGLENEMEVIKSKNIALNVVKTLNLYTSYRYEGRFLNPLLYRSQPITVELDPQSVDALQSPINLRIAYEDGKYVITGSYNVVHKERGSEERSIKASLPLIPARIRTAVGNLTFLRNSESTAHMKQGQDLLVSIIPPAAAAGQFAGHFDINQLGKTTSIATITFTDENPGRANDYLEQIVTSYNDEGNNDKNIIAVRTEEFINSRLEKINVELGMTEGQLESFKRQNHMVDVGANSSYAFGQSNNYDQQLAEMNTQLALFNSINEYMNSPSNKYQTLPSNVGLTDQAASSLIDTYNKIVLERNKLLRTANENSPSVIPLTEQLNDLTASIKRAMSQARNNYEIRRNAMQNQLSKYTAQVQQSPAQERILNQIGRQQEVRSGLYLMLLQKREENSISLAATADKGKLLDAPSCIGKIYPNDKSVMMMALAVGFFLPLVLILLLHLMRYKIEGRNDIMKVTTLPILAEVPVARESAKTTADIVIKENQNNLMEEVFRSLRTNMMFMLKNNQKTILFTSSLSGEGKTFVAANLAMSFALLDKKVVLVGLDIRRPRLADLFGVMDRSTGMSTLLSIDDPTEEEVMAQVRPTEQHPNLNLLLAGPVPPNPAEIVTRPSLDKVFEVLQKNYDYVIIDTAPVGLVTDTLSIGRVADVSVYVCRADYTPKSSLEQVNEYAHNNKLPNIAIVLNGIDMSKKKYGYYYGYGRYGKYGRYGRYGRYSRYGNYGRYSNYSTYGNYSYSHYGQKNDTSVKM